MSICCFEVRQMNRMQRHILCTALLLGAFFGAIRAFSLWFSAEQAMALAAAPVTVVIDAGHGGEDGGAVGVGGSRESTLNLEIALRVRDLLALMGMQTRMVRESDTAVYSGRCDTIAEKKVSDLKNRVALVRETPNALLLSIHQNFFTEEKYHGAQVFYAQGEESRLLAERMQEALRTLSKDNHRACKSAEGVYLMQHIDCTGVLVECGFLSNAREEQLLCSEGYQKKLSAAICGALVGYISEERNTHEV